MKTPRVPLSNEKKDMKNEVRHDSLLSIPCDFINVNFDANIYLILNLS